MRIYTYNKNITCKCFNTGIVLRWILIIEDYGPGIEYIKDEKNIGADELSRLPSNGNQETTQKSTYKREIVSEIIDIEELPEGTFTINLKLIQKYKRQEPSIIAKYKYSKYHKGYFHGNSNTDIKLIMFKDKIVIPSKLQSYVLHWYHAYILHPGMDITETMICKHLYWTDIRNVVRMEVTNCDSCQYTKQSNKKHDKLPDKLAEEI